MKFSRSPLSFIAASALVLSAACGDSGVTGSDNANGTVVVQLTDAPFSSDSVKSVNMFVTRIDARTASADDAAADQDVDTPSSGGWQTIATPNASIDLLTLQHGTTSTLGQTTLKAGTYSGLRMIIDPTKSNVTLKNGTVLTSSSSPSVTFPSAAHSGIKINLSQPLTVSGGATTNLLIDFDVNNSFVLRGNSINQNGLLFKPVIKATVSNGGTASLATVALVNATNSTLNLVQGGNVLTNGSAIAFGGSSSCTTVPSTTPDISVTSGTSTTPLAGFSPTLTAGTSYTIVAYPNATGTTTFATLPNTFTATSGQAGFRVFNATTNATGYDVLVGTSTTTNVAAGASSTFTSVPAGSSQIRLMNTGSTSVLLDLGAQTLTAGKNQTLVIAPAATGSTTPRAFLVTGC